MRTRLVVFVSCMLISTLGVASADPAPASAQGTSPARRPSSLRSHHAAAAHSTGRIAPGAGHAGPRRLEDVHIEGEIPVPQVLFVTARDSRRFLEFQHQHYLKSSRELAEATPVPKHVVLSPASPAPPAAPASEPPR